MFLTPSREASLNQQCLLLLMNCSRSIGLPFTTDCCWSVFFRYELDFVENKMFDLWFLISLMKPGICRVISFFKWMQLFKSVDELAIFRVTPISQSSTSSALIFKKRWRLPSVFEARIRSYSLFLSAPAQALYNIGSTLQVCGSSHSGIFSLSPLIQCQEGNFWSVQQYQHIGSI